jgi:hypothetical protein
MTRLALLTALIATLAAGSQAQSLRERMQQGVSKVQQGAVGAAGRIGESVDSSVDLMTNEQTPQETRTKLDAMADETLVRLFAEQPEAAELFELSAGYAVFDTRKLVLFGLAAGAGRGVAVSRTENPRHIYMNMATGGVGMSLGLGGFETQVAILFKDEWDFDEFGGLCATSPRVAASFSLEGSMTLDPVPVASGGGAGPQARLGTDSARRSTSARLRFIARKASVSAAVLRASPK